MRFPGWLVVMFALALTACVSVSKHEYPSEWPPASPGDASCRSISGSYESSASRWTFDDYRKTFLLASVLMPDGVDVRSARTVELDVDADGSLRVTAYGKALHVVATHTYAGSSGFAECRNATLMIHPEKKPRMRRAADNPLVGVAHSLISLRKAQDGSLIMRETGQATGVAYLLVPVHAETEQWYLFQPVRQR